MKNDIENKEDIRVLVESFYENVKKDEVINMFFTHLDTENWQHHLERMCDFWHNAIFFSGSYIGNPMKSHKMLHILKGLDLKHFERWNELFVKTVDSLFEGKNATSIKQTAINISTVMQIKILGSHVPLLEI